MNHNRRRPRLDPQVMRFFAIILPVLVLTIIMTVLALRLPMKKQPREEALEEEYEQGNVVPSLGDDESWEEVMIRAVTSGDSAGGEWAQYCLMRLTATGAAEDVLWYDDLLWLSKIMMAESGPNWPDWAVMAVGEVVLNRVSSEEFEPESIQGILTQATPIQYEPVYSAGWEELLPEERYVRLAMRLLSGERVLNDPSIVFQSQYEWLGSRVVVSYYDSDLDTTTYFNRSRYPQFYE